MPTALLPGFEQYKDVLNRRLNDTEIIEISNEAVRQTLDVHNQHTNAMVQFFCDPTTDFKRRFKSPFAGYLQAGDNEFGRYQPNKQFGTYDIAFPLATAGKAWGWTRKYAIKSTVQDVNDQLALMLDADKRYLRYNILAALFQDTDFTFEDEEHGTLTVKPLANGDAQEYMLLQGAETATTADHYEAQAGAIADNANPFPNIYDKLNSRPENGEGRVISFVPTNLRTSVEALSTFIEKSDPDIQEGANTRVLVGNLETPIPGEVVGKVGDVWVVEWKFLPSNYILSVHTGGPRPLAMRQEPEAELQGFRAIGDREDMPYFERHFERTVGFGVQNRLSAHIQRIGNGAYAVPTGFTRQDVMG